MLARGGAQALLETLSTGGRRVALLLASEDDGDGPVDALFSQTASLFPEARRALLIDWGAWADRATADRVLALLSGLLIDFYVVRPADPADEDFPRPEERRYGKGWGR